jgi:hypothetical protein
MPRQVTLKELVERRFAIDGVNNFHSKVEFVVQLFPFADPTVIKVGPAATPSGGLSKKRVAVTTGPKTQSFAGTYKVELLATVVEGVSTPEP